ncbi:ABC transporter ATP-binding protein/permease [Fusobacterium nucleatum]|uniref:ABC transporter ATP-binding protein n=1 Tax=Fusobacterium nucleatum TaxID=851 RepID=UPI0030D5DFE6
MKQKSWISIAFSFASQCKWRIILSVIFAIIGVFAGIVPYWCIYKIITLFVNKNIILNQILYYCIIAVLGYGVRYLFHGISTTLSHFSAYKILENIRLSLAKKLIDAPLGYVLGESVGKLKSVIVDRVETIELPLAHVIPECISNITLSISVFAYLVFIDWRMAISMLITVPIAGTVYMLMMRNFNEEYAKYMETSNYVNGVIVEYVEGIEVIKAFNQSTNSYKRFVEAIETFRDSTLAWYKGVWKYMNFGNAVLPSTFLGVLPVGLILYLNGEISPQNLVISLILSLGVVGPMMNFTNYINEAKAIEYALHDVDKLLQIPVLSNSKQDTEITDYNIKLQNVSFSYDGNMVNKVLSKINCIFENKQFIALVGPSGSGKTTIARLIARFWDTTEGNIYIGGKDIKDIPISKLNELISFVTQDTYLFNCSVKENIRLGNPEATDDEVFQAAKLACCDEFIQTLEDGYDTIVGNAGNKLSGGEKQRISIARMILKNSPIVILDEATAFTDPENESKLQQSLGALSKGKLLLVIAHRLSTIKNADRIFVINSGEIQAVGKHEELLDTNNLYKNMWLAHIGAKNWSANSNGKEEL